MDHRQYHNKEEGEPFVHTGTMSIASGKTPTRSLQRQLTNRRGWYTGSRTSPPAGKFANIYTNISIKTIKIPLYNEINKLPQNHRELTYRIFFGLSHFIRYKEGLLLLV